MKQNKAVFIVVTCIALLYIGIFKATTTIRLGGPTLPHYPDYIFYLISSALRVNYGMFIINLPHILWEVVRRYTNKTIFTFGIILGVVIFGYLCSIIFRSQSNFPKRVWMRSITLLSFVIFLLGYAIFLTNANEGFSSAGIENRVAIAAAIGVAFSIVGGLGWVSRRLLPDKLSKIFFCFLIAAMCSSGFLIINTIASFWIVAYQQEQIVLADIHTTFPVMKKNSTLILDGVCPYVGPASVFESEWDVKGALQTTYHDATLQGDIVTPKLQVKNDGIYTKIYNFETRYPYNKNLFIYNFKNKIIYPIPNEKATRLYFHAFNPDHNNGCPPGIEGNGVNVF